MVICFGAVIAIAIQTKNESESSELSEEEKEDSSQDFTGLVIIFTTSFIRAMCSVLNKVLKHHATPVIVFLMFLLAAQLISKDFVKMPKSLTG